MQRAGCARSYSAGGARPWRVGCEELEQRGAWSGGGEACGAVTAVHGARLRWRDCSAVAAERRRSNAARRARMRRREGSAATAERAGL
jgi:hypothetical protein